jgi:hypothetical protein
MRLGKKCQSIDNTLVVTGKTEDKKSLNNSFAKIVSNVHFILARTRQLGSGGAILLTGNQPRTYDVLDIDSLKAA